MLAPESCSTPSSRTPSALPLTAQRCAATQAHHAFSQRGCMASQMLEQLTICLQMHGCNEPKLRANCSKASFGSNTLPSDISSFASHSHFALLPPAKHVAADTRLKARESCCREHHFWVALGDALPNGCLSASPASLSRRPDPNPRSSSLCEAAGLFSQLHNCLYFHHAGPSQPNRRNVRHINRECRSHARAPLGVVCNADMDALRIECGFRPSAMDALGSAREHGVLPRSDMGGLVHVSTGT